MVVFHWRVKEVAWIRQGGSPERGAKCAICCIELDRDNENKMVGNGWYAIQKNPNGTKKIDNCVIVCSKCLTIIEQNFPYEIPMKELPCWGIVPKH